MAAGGWPGYPSLAPPALRADPMSEIAVVLFVAALVLGATRIPAIGDAIGRIARGDRRPPAPDHRDADDPARKDPPTAR